MCSSVFGPAIEPCLVTWPVRKMGVGVCLANILNWAATSRICETLPGGASIFSLKTRSISSIPDDVRASSCDSIVPYAIGTAARYADEKLLAAAAGDVARKRSSTSVFHSEQSGHWPSHLRDCPPQLWQTKIVAG